jgi:mono/diheme cytochrome c family protein
MKRLSMLTPVAVSALVLASCGSSRRSVPVAGPMAFPNPEVALGERVFMRECSACHPEGEAGLAPGINNKPLPSFLIRLQIREGIGAMPSFTEREISDDEIDAVIEYLQYMRGRRWIRRSS